ncbi:MAG TPA: PilN domain-containing protein [Tepidisphaeraceae bacterium]|jgi:Tfp pilus assembly protein PilN
MASPNQLSFLPDDYLEKKLRRRTNAILGTLFLVVVCAIGGTLFWKEQTTRQLEKQKSELDGQLTEAAKPIEQFKQMQEKQQQLAKQAEITSSLLERVPRSYLLAEITNGIPGGVSLLDFNLDSKLRAGAPAPSASSPNNNGAPAPAPAPQARNYDVNMRLTGVAGTDVQVAQFISKLSRSPLFKDVNLLISEEFKNEKETLRKFQVEMTLSPDFVVSSADIKRQNEQKTAAVPVGQ